MYWLFKACAADIFTAVNFTGPISHPRLIYFTSSIQVQERWLKGDSEVIALGLVLREKAKSSSVPVTGTIMESVWDPGYMHKSHKARDRGRAECTQSWSRLSTFPIHWGSAKKNKQKTTKRNQMSCKWLVRESGSPVAFISSPQAGKLEKALRAVLSFSVGTDWGAAGREGSWALGKDVSPTHTGTDHL